MPRPGVDNSRRGLEAVVRSSGARALVPARLSNVTSFVGSNPACRTFRPLYRSVNRGSQLPRGARCFLKTPSRMTTEGGRAKADYVAAGHAERAKTVRLKALREAKEAVADKKRGPT